MACRSRLLEAAVFSLRLNLLYLVVPIYSLRIYDRVLPSTSGSTLLAYARDSEPSLQQATSTATIRATLSGGATMVCLGYG